MSNPKLSDLVALWLKEINAGVEVYPKNTTKSAYFIDRVNPPEGGMLCWIATVWDEPNYGPGGPRVKKPCIIINTSPERRIYPEDPDFFTQLKVAIDRKLAACQMKLQH